MGRLFCWVISKTLPHMPQINTNQSYYRESSEAAICAIFINQDLHLSMHICVICGGKTRYLRSCSKLLKYSWQLSSA
jgi:hypothetical protein